MTSDDGSGFETGECSEHPSESHKPTSQPNERGIMTPPHQVEPEGSLAVLPGRHIDHVESSLKFLGAPHWIEPK